MGIRHPLTPEAFLAAPRRSPAVPAPSSRLAFYTSSTHIWGHEGKGTTQKQLVLVDLAAEEHWPLSTATDDMHDVCWIPSSAAETGHAPDELLWLRPAADGSGATELVVTEVSALQDVDLLSPLLTPYVAAVVPAPIKALRLRPSPDGTVLLAAAGLVGDGGVLYNPQTAVRGSTGRVYDTWQVREWDTYLFPQRYGLWYGALVRGAAEHWSLAGPLHNALRHAPAHLETPASIYEPGDATNDFDIGPSGIVFVGRDRTPADQTTGSCSSVYYVPLDSFTDEALFPPTRVALALSSSSLSSSFSALPAAVSGAFSSAPPPPPGFASNVRFTPDGVRLAFLWAPLDCPADQRLQWGEVPSGAVVDVARVVTGSGSGSWPVIPSAFEFAPSGEAVVFTAHDCGRRKLFWLALQPGGRPQPIQLGAHGSVTAAAVLVGRGDLHSADSPPTVSLLVSGSSFVESCFYALVDVVAGADEVVTLCLQDMSSSRGAAEARSGLSHARQVTELYVGGAGDYCVQAWVVRPSWFDESQTTRYPLAVLVHGGPETAWEDEWHERWNAAVWAEQGYVVVLPNVTGSVGFGLEHTKRIYGSWGGYPYEDLVQCLQGLEAVPYMDTRRAVLAGASYGGYLVNWILGSPLATKFCAAVSHNGVYSTETMGLTSDVSDGVAAFGGSGLAWENSAGVQRWNPARADRVGTWRARAPPTLVVHSERDYRLAVTDGLATFRALQFQGVPSRFLIFPDEGHFVQDRDNALAWHRLVLGWLRQWTSEAGRAEDRQRRGEV